MASGSWVAGEANWDVPRPFGGLLARLDEKRLMMARQHPSAPASVHESCDLSANSTTPSTGTGVFQ